MPDGSIVLMGGSDGTNCKSDVWRFMPAGSSEQNPLHTYTKPGIYNIALQVFNSGGYDSIRKIGYITVTGSSAPVAAFSGTPRTGISPLGVKYTDSSTGTSITNRRWDFGDGNISTYSVHTNPFHIYSNAGVYTVNLTVTGSGGSDSEVKTNYIKVSVPVKVRIVPNTLNIASKGKFVAFITLPNNYKAADVDAKSVVCEGATAIRLIRIKAFPNTFAAVFSRDKLVNVKPSDKVKLTVTGTINKNGQKIGFSGTDIIKVTNKKGNTKEAIDDVERMTDEKVFSQFNPR